MTKIDECIAERSKHDPEFARQFELENLKLQQEIEAQKDKEDYDDAMKIISSGNRKYVSAQEIKEKYGL